MKSLRQTELAKSLNLDNQTDWGKQDLKGKVKYFIHQIGDEKVKVSFNEKGQEIEEYFFEENEKWVFEYEKKRITKSIYINEIFNEKYILIFDDKANSMEAKSVSSDGKEVKTQSYQCDNNNNIIQHELYDCDNNRVKTIHRQYNKEDNLIEEIINDNDISEKNTYQYDEKNNLIKENHYCKPNPNSELIKTFFKDKEIPADYLLDTKKLYLYNDDNNVIEEITIEINEDTKEETRQKTTFKYNKEDYVIEKIAYSADYEESDYYEKWIYEYDAYGYQILERKYFPDGELAEEIINEFTYDVYGNWIKCVERSQGIEITEDGIERTNDISVQTRSFEYY